MKPLSLYKKRPEENDSRENRHGGILQLMKVLGLAPLNQLVALLWMCHPGHGITIKQLLAIRHVRGRDGVVDRSPARSDAYEPQHRRPERMCEKMDPPLADGLGLGERMHGRIRSGREAEQDVKGVDEDPAVPQDGFESAVQRSAESRVALVQLIGDTA